MKLPALRIPSKNRLAAAVAIAAGVLVASTLPVYANVADDSPSLGAMRLESPATLQARGAAVTVPILVVCPAGVIAFPQVFVAQRVGGSIASGSGGTQITCTGTFQTVEVTAVANLEPFRRGIAVASASMFISGIGTVSDQREIEIDRPT
jgi:hypothetical protein